MNHPIRIAINGFGRIGRSAFRVLLAQPSVEVVAINDLHDQKLLGHLLSYDSVHGRLDLPVAVANGRIRVGDKVARVFCEAEPANLPWADMGIDVVLECTGRFADSGSRAHLGAGASRVVVSAPSADADVTIVMGVNHTDYRPGEHLIISNASCTTNCLAPVIKVLHDNFVVEKGLVTTVHSYTNDQMLTDQPHEDLRRARSASMSIIPTTTGAARAVGLVLPELEGKLDGVSVRVPTPNVSFADITVKLAGRVTFEVVNETLKKAANGELEGILGYTETPLVSVDYIGCEDSATVDGPQTRVVDGDLVKVSAWYDNEWGYAHRLCDLLKLIAAQNVASRYGT